MFIVSKFKDYYDFLQGVYGVDEKLILDRTNFVSNISLHYDVITLFIGEYKIQGYIKEGKIYWGKEIEQFSSEDRWRGILGNDNEDCYYIKTEKSRDIRILKAPLFLGDKCPTWKKDCPILLEWVKDDYIKNPILSELNIQKVFPAHDIWLILTDWLSKRITKREPDIPIGDDKTRILSAGFDLKQSFRHRK